MWGRSKRPEAVPEVHETPEEKAAREQKEIVENIRKAQQEYEKRLLYVEARLQMRFCFKLAGLPSNPADIVGHPYFLDTGLRGSEGDYWKEASSGIIQGISVYKGRLVKVTLSKPAIERSITPHNYVQFDCFDHQHIESFGRKPKGWHAIWMEAQFGEQRFIERLNFKVL